jgi:hypothetical protein
VFISTGNIILIALTLKHWYRVLIWFDVVQVLMLCSNYINNQVIR